jgi:hypothetical protein
MRDGLAEAETGPATMLASIETRVAALGLHLAGRTVVTEAATGAYACTATIAALAGAQRVVARARDTARHGTARDAAAATLGLARAAGVADRIEVVADLPDSALAGCDILTNSGHLRPITRRMIELLPRHAVIGLMFEAWEFRGADLDIAACRERGIRVAAVNERHPDVAVFPFLGPLAVRLLADASVTRAGSRVALVCDNPFAPFILDGLQAAGFRAQCFERLASVGSDAWDAVVIALDPARNPTLDAADFARLAAVAAGAPLAQFWGDVDRAAAARAGFGNFVPIAAPGPGHMGILLNALGPEPIIRLQAGGLKAAELVLVGDELAPGSVAELL